MKNTQRSSFFSSIAEHLEREGINLEQLVETCKEGAVKMVCVGADIGESIEALGESSRDKVVMVRVDKETVRRLDAWVEIGAVKSRSEAAALFIREGLDVRTSELRDLEEALRDVETARENLRKRAKTVLGRDLEPGDSAKGRGDDDSR